MTNEELAAAIAFAFRCCNEVGTIASCGGEMLTHLKALLEIQRARAILMVEG